MAIAVSDFPIVSGHRHCALPFMRLTLQGNDAWQVVRGKGDFWFLILISRADNVYYKKSVLSTYRNIICHRTGLLFSEGCYNMLNVKNTSDGNRSRLQIIAEILTQVRIPVGKANIMSHCNMSTAQSGQYLNLMTSSDLVRMGAYAGKVTYQRTEVGLEFLELFKKMALLLDSGISSPFLV